MMRATAGIAGVLLLSACAYAPPPKPVSAAGAGSTVLPAAVWRKVDAETGKIADLAGLQELAEAFPDSSSVRLRLLRRHARTKNIAGAVKEAMWLAERGYSFSDAARAQILEMAGDTAIAAKLGSMLDRNSGPIAASSLAATIPADALLVEGVAIDPQTGSLDATSVVSRKLHRQSADGSWGVKDLSRNGRLEPQSLSGIAFDPSGTHRWIAAGALGMTPKEGTYHVGAYHTERHAETTTISRLRAPKDVNLSDVTVADSGTAYFSDPVGGGVYFAEPSYRYINTLIEPGQFRSPQGLATSTDSSKLYISDYRYGLGVFDFQTMSVHRLSAQAPMILDGIDGLWRYGNRLIAVQNGTNPMRIVSIELSPDGMSATNLTVLEQAHPAWSEPLGGSIHDGALYYVANGQWDRFGKGGALNPDKPPIPTQIRRLPLD